LAIPNGLTYNFFTLQAQEEGPTAKATTDVTERSIESRRENAI